MFAACITRPDIMCTVGQLSQFLNNPWTPHMFGVKRVLHYLKRSLARGIMYRPPPMRLGGFY